MLSGYKTYITAGIGLILAVGSLLGVLPSGVTVNDPGSLLIAMVGLIFARIGVVK